MLSLISRTFRLAALAAVVATGSAALATNLPKGGTLDPSPGAASPGGTNIYSTSKSFTVTTNMFPNVYHTYGTAYYNVYRLADNTLTFSFSMTNTTTSDVITTQYAMRDFGDFTTNIWHLTGLIINGSVPPASISRSSDGSLLTFYHNEIANHVWSGAPSRTVYIKTNATQFDLQGVTTVYSNTEASSTTITGVPRPVLDSTPPIVSITSPTSIVSVCNPVAITGTARDPEGFDHYDVEYASNINGPWTLISTSTSQVTSGTLASWNTTAISQGYYYIRVSAFNEAGLDSQVTTLNFVDKQFDTVDLRSPGAGAILGGGICFDGTISDGNGTGSFNHYTIEYAPLPAASPYHVVDNANLTYNTPVQNDPLGSWITNTGPTAVADGNYRLRVIGYDDCGYTKSVTRDITVDNTVPIGIITSPTSCTSLDGTIVIRGTASDTNLAGWTLQYTGGPSHGWTTIASGNTNVVNGVLANWNTAGLPTCAYTIRLIVSDRSGMNCSGYTNQAEYTTSIRLGCDADVDDGGGRGIPDGGVGIEDLLYYLSQFDQGC
jgi:hypothetical protein